MSGERPLERVLYDKEEAAIACGVSLSHFMRHIAPFVEVVHSGQLNLYPVEGLRRWAQREAVVGGRRPPVVAA